MWRTAIVFVLAALGLSACTNYHGIYNRTPNDFFSTQTRHYPVDDPAVVVAAARKSLQEMGYTVSTEGSGVGILVAWERAAPETPEAGAWKPSDWSAFVAKENNSALNQAIAQQFYADPASNPPRQEYTKNKFWNSVLNTWNKPSPPSIPFPGRSDDERASIVIVPLPRDRLIQVRAWFDQVAGRPGSAYQTYSRDYDPELYAAFFRGMAAALPSSGKTP